MDRYRTTQLGLGLALVAVIALGIAFGLGRGDAPALPDVIESISPSPGSLINRPWTIRIDMKPGYRIELWVEVNSTAGTWQRIPDAEIQVQEPTGVFTWAPGFGDTIERWEAGSHRVRVVWDTVTGLPDVGEYEWEYRSA